MKNLPPAGLEPAIPGLGGRCLIHWATEAAYDLAFWLILKHNWFANRNHCILICNHRIWVATTESGLPMYEQNWKSLNVHSCRGKHERRIVLYVVIRVNQRRCTYKERETSSSTPCFVAVFLLFRANLCDWQVSTSWLESVLIGNPVNLVGDAFMDVRVRTTGYGSLDWAIFRGQFLLGSGFGNLGSISRFEADQGNKNTINDDNWRQ